MAEVIDFFVEIFGIGADELHFLQVLSRAVLVFCVGILLMRIGKKRFLGKMSAFDIIIAVILGSLLSRAITRNDLFLEMLAAALLLVLLHRTFSFAAGRWHSLGPLIKGRDRVVIKNGEIIWEALHASSLTKNDLMQTMRLNAKTEDISRIKIARLERNGDVSFLLRDAEEENSD